MHEIQIKLKRQFEIVGMCISKSYSITELQDFFDVEEATINRDLKDIRSFGIDIHSTKRNGIQISQPIEESLLENIINQYMALCVNNEMIDKSTNLLIKKSGNNSLILITKLQYCIENSFIAKILYNKEGDNSDEKIIRPLLLFRNEGSWRLISQTGDKFKQYLLEKILSIDCTEEKYEKNISLSLDEIFKTSWKSWLSEEKFEIELLVDKKWADRIIPRILIHNQEIIHQDDGSIIFNATVNSIDEIASWIVSRGKGVKVISPDELKEKVISLARGALQNYE